MPEQTVFGDLRELDLAYEQRLAPVTLPSRDDVLQEWRLGRPDCLESSVNFVPFFLFEIDVLDDGAPMEE